VEVFGGRRKRRETIRSDNVTWSELEMAEEFRVLKAAEDDGCDRSRVAVANRGREGRERGDRGEERR